MTTEEKIAELINIRDNFNYTLTPNEVFDGAIKALKQQSKTGYWIALGNYDDYGEERSYKCSECGDIDAYHDNYCPNCGTKMIKVIRKREINES